VALAPQPLAHVAAQPAEPHQPELHMLAPLVSMWSQLPMRIGMIRYR
jgi:hypothetical protein